MRGARSSLVMALLAIAATPGAIAAVADDPNPEKVLEGRGLKRSGTLYVLDQESDFVPKVAKLRPTESLFREGDSEPPSIRTYVVPLDSIWSGSAFRNLCPTAFFCVG